MTHEIKVKKTLEVKVLYYFLSKELMQLLVISYQHL